MREAHNSKLKIQNSKLPQATIQNSKLKTQNVRQATQNNQSPTPSRCKDPLAVASVADVRRRSGCVCACTDHGDAAPYGARHRRHRTRYRPTLTASVAASIVRDGSHPLLGHHKGVDTIYTVHLRSLARCSSLYAAYEQLAVRHGVLHAVLRVLISVLQHRPAPLLYRHLSGGALVSSAPTKPNTSTRYDGEMV